MASSITKKLMGGGSSLMGEMSEASPSDEAAPEGSEGEMAAEDFANATDAAARYAAFKRMFRACEMEGHSEVEDDEEGGY